MKKRLLCILLAAALLCSPVLALDSLAVTAGTRGTTAAHRLNRSGRTHF